MPHPQGGRDPLLPRREGHIDVLTLRVCPSFVQLGGELSLGGYRFEPLPAQNHWYGRQSCQLQWLVRSVPLQRPLERVCQECLLRFGESPGTAAGASRGLCNPRFPAGVRSWWWPFIPLLRRAAGALKWQTAEGERPGRASRPGPAGPRLRAPTAVLGSSNHAVLTLQDETLWWSWWEGRFVPDGAGTPAAGRSGQARTLANLTYHLFVGPGVAAWHQTSFLDCVLGQPEHPKDLRGTRWSLLWTCSPTPACPQRLQSADDQGADWGQGWWREGMPRDSDAHHTGQRGGLPPPPVPVAAEQPAGGGRGSRAAALPLGRPEAERVHPAQLLRGREQPAARELWSFGYGDLHHVPGPRNEEKWGPGLELWEYPCSGGLWGEASGRKEEEGA